MMKQYLEAESVKTFRQKSKGIRELINTTLYILETFGIPIDGTPRRIERMALSFLACADVRRIAEFSVAKDLKIGHSLKTREIIVFINKNFKENISPGSYDDIRRKDLKLLTVAGIILQSSPKSATNDSTRGYGLAPFYARLIRNYGQANWNKEVELALSNIDSLSLTLKRERNLPKVEVSLPSGKELEFSLGRHNDLQKKIIEEFLPRFGFGAEVLYVGDTSDKYLHLNKRRLAELDFFDLAHEELPDIVAYSQDRNWLYLIEAVHSSGPISEIRLLQLKQIAEKCSADLVFVTAFLDRISFRKFMSEIAWETEVWIADNPDHMVHFNGDKFLGPHKE